MKTTNGPTVTPLPINMEDLQKSIDKKYFQILDLLSRPKTESLNKLLETHWLQYNELVRLKKEGLEFDNQNNPSPQ